MRRRDLLTLLLLAAAPALAPGSAKAGETGGETKKVGSATYVAMDTLTGATTKANGRRGVLSVECGLDIPDAGLRARAESLLPRLRAAYLQTVLIYAAGLPPDAPPNADFIGRALQRETDAALGRPGARLLLGAILVS